MSARDRAQEAAEAALEWRRMRKAAKKEKRQVKKAVRRSKIWGAAHLWWSLRQDISNDPKAKKKIRRVATTLNPMAGLIAAAALEIDRVVAPTALDFIDEKKAVSRAILQEMVDQGRISEAQAGILADQVDAILTGNGAPEPVPTTIPGPGPRPLLSSNGASTTEAVNYWPYIAAIGALFLIRGS